MTQFTRLDGDPAVHYTFHQVIDQAHTLLLIHGAGGSQADWPLELRVHPRLSVIALDLPGHGRSPGSGCATIAEYAQVVGELVTALSLEKVVLGGHSMGGAIALTSALSRPGWLTGLMVCNSGATMPVNPQILHDTRHDLPAFVTFFNRYAWSSSAGDELKSWKQEELLTVNPAVLHQDFVACASFDAGQQLPQIRVPVLIVAGERDKLMPPAASERMASGLVDGRLHILPGRGHMLPREAPQEIAALAAAFVHTL